MSSHRKPPPARAPWGARGAELARSPRVGGGLFLAGTVVAVVAMASMTPDTSDDVEASRIVTPLAAQPRAAETSPSESGAGAEGGAGDSGSSEGEQDAQAEQSDGRIVAGSGRGSTDSSSGVRRTAPGTAAPSITDPLPETGATADTGSTGGTGSTAGTDTPDAAGGTEPGAPESSTPGASGTGQPTEDTAPTREDSGSSPRSTTDVTPDGDGGRGPLLASGGRDEAPPALASTDAGDVLRPPSYSTDFDDSAELPPTTVAPPTTTAAKPVPTKPAAVAGTPDVPVTTPVTPAAKPPTSAKPAAPVTVAPATGSTATPDAPVQGPPSAEGTAPADAPTLAAPGAVTNPLPRPESTGPDAADAKDDGEGAPEAGATEGTTGTTTEDGATADRPNPEPTGTDSSHSVPRPDGSATPGAPATETPVTTETPTAEVPTAEVPTAEAPTAEAPPVEAPTPAPTAAIGSIAPGGADLVPAGRSGTPVVVTGTALDAADFWTVGGQRVEPIEVTAERVVLVVPPGAADGQVAAGESSAGLDLGDVVPGVLAAAPLVWGLDCAEPAQTGLVWVAGSGLGSGAVSADGTKRAGQKLADGTLVVPVGSSTPDRVWVSQDGWTTVVTVQDKAVDVSGVSQLPGLQGDDCPMSAGTSRIGLVTTNQATQLKGVYTPDRTPLRFVPISESAIAVLLPRGDDAGTRTVKVLKNNGNMWERPLQVVRTGDVAADGQDLGTLLAAQVVERSVP